MSFRVHPVKNPWPCNGFRFIKQSENQTYLYIIVKGDIAMVTELVTPHARVWYVLQSVI